MISTETIIPLMAKKGTLPSPTDTYKIRKGGDGEIYECCNRMCLGFFSGRVETDIVLDTPVPTESDSEALQHLGEQIHMTLIEQARKSH